MTREEAIQEFQNVKDLIRQDGKDWFDGRDLELIDMAIEALSADAVSLTGTMKYLTKPHNYCEVVRCKDCKHKYMDGEVTHYYWCRLHDRPVDDTDYCAWGEESEVEE